MLNQVLVAPVVVREWIRKCREWSKSPSYVPPSEIGVEEATLLDDGHLLIFIRSKTGEILIEINVSPDNWMWSGPSN
jgi:hypothetical protein